MSQSDIEAIRQTRLLGARHLDAGDWTALADLYTSDAVCEFGPYGTWTDQSAFADSFRDAEAPFVQAGPYSNLHVVVNHIVTMAGPDSATGLIYLLDFVTEPSMMRDATNPLFWLGVYDEEYRRVGDGWKIARQSLNFIWPERNLNDGFVERHATPAAAPAAPSAADRALDLAEIEQLSARYAAGLDRFDLDALMAPFSDDVVFDAGPMGLESYSGAASLREFFGHNQEVMADQMHLFSNFVIDFDGPDDAHGSNYLLQDGHNKQGGTVKCFCRNDDTYRRVDGRWRITTRTISPLMPPQLEGY